MKSYTRSWASLAALVVASESHGAYIEEFQIPTVDSQPSGIVVGPDKRIWFTETLGNSIGNIDPLAPSDIRELSPLPNPSSLPTAIVLGPDGNLWFSESEAPRIGMITPPNRILEFDLPAGVRAGDAMVADPNGLVWFSVFTTTGLGLASITTDAAHVIRTYAVPVGVAGEIPGLTLGADGNLWLTESTLGPRNVHTNARIARALTSDPTNYKEFPIIPDDFAPQTICNDGIGNLWFSSNGNSVGTLPLSDPTNIAQYSLDVGIFAGMTKGPDSNVWFSDYGFGKIGMIAPTGLATTFDIPSSLAHPEGISVGPDGNIWFVDDGKNAVGVMRLDGIFKDGLEPVM